MKPIPYPTNRFGAPTLEKSDFDLAPFRCPCGRSLTHFTKEELTEIIKAARRAIKKLDNE